MDLFKLSFNPRILIFSAVEVVALVIWLVLALQVDNILSGILAVVVLIGGFTLEHLITYNVIHNRPLFNFSGIPVGQKFVVSIIETILWVIWLVIINSTTLDTNLNIVLATGFLFLTLLLEHTISDNVFTHRGLFSRLFDRRVVGFTIIEAVGAGIWVFYALQTDYGFIGIIILAIASVAEHYFAVNLSQRGNFVRFT